MSEPLKGLNGRVARVDLEARTFEARPVAPEIYEQYLGGVGLAAKLVYDELSDADYARLRDDPLAPVNPLVFSTGPLTATAAPSSSRYAVAGISPLTGYWGESTSGGFFPGALKRCGFDAILFTGAADAPVYVDAHDRTIEVRDAAPYWGLNTRETIAKIRVDSGDAKARVATIGRAGEHLVKYAAILNDEGRAAGRCGLGTLMGSKHLKALVVHGTERIPLADGKKIAQNSKRALANVHNAFSTNFFQHYGTLCYTDMGMVLGDVPVKYFTSTEFVAENLTGRRLKERYPVTKYACAGCTIGCGRTTFVDWEGNGEETAIDGPEYETVAALGPLCGIEDFDPILRANHTCNLEGVDTISAGVCIAFLLYLADRDLAREQLVERLDGIAIDDLRWGNARVVQQLLDRLVRREGIGDLLAEGVKEMARQLGVDPGLAAHVKGLEIPMHDPRAYAGQALTYATACVGASHEKGDFFNIDGDAASFGKVRKGPRFDIAGREAAVATYQDMACLYDSLVVCNFPHVNFQSLGRMLRAATGFKLFSRKKYLFQVGERATNLKRLISIKLGLTGEMDALPGIVTRVLSTGGTDGVKLELEEPLQAYYAARGWDEHGVPTEGKLADLGLI